MLKLVNITKDYKVADTTVGALKGVNLEFRKNEFVSILGPSGCGKTTLLNIIGGLDDYTSGELFIDNISTKEFGDRDWDTYRNHRIGFIFQSYNLIPHQTILENVALALAISGMGKDERIAKAKAALDEVGLKDQYNKKPNQLSGGQCQRVAIARALVNEPEILLADEPTGALDTVTSVQIMDLIKEIAKERLVIMVTHNPELAEKYSTRIIKLLDGNVVSDSKPYKSRKEKPPVKENSTKKSKLSWWTAFKLSAKNLRSKFKRTLMVCLAGSIGIIGVATVLAVSNGVQGYINTMQDDMLSGNPITITEEALNITGLMSGLTTTEKAEVLKSSIKDGYVDVQHLMDILINKEGDVTSFKTKNDITDTYIKYLQNMPSKYISTITYDYGFDIGNNLYTNNIFNGQGENADKSISFTAIKALYTSMLNKTEFKEYAGFITTLINTIDEIPDNKDFVMSQYEFVTDNTISKYPTQANEVVLVVDGDEKLSDLLLALTGYYTQDEFFNAIYKKVADSDYDPALDKENFSYNELLGKSLVYYPNNSIYTKTPDASPLASTFPFSYNPYMPKDGGTELTITGILKPKEGLSYGCLDTGIYYTTELTKQILIDNVTSEIVNYLNDSEQKFFGTTVVNGTPVTKGVNYSYTFQYRSDTPENVTTLLYSTAGSSMMSAMMGGSGDSNTTVMLTPRQLGGVDIPNMISIYPVDFELKDKVVDYLDAWNNDGNITVDGTTYSSSDRSEIVYTDSISLIIGLINTMIDVITYALIAFTALSLVVSTVMIAIITYVSVIERVKEIGVIRSLGGRKRDVSNLFIAETFIIGLSSGVLGIGITYLLSFIINMIVGSLSGIYTIASLPITAALIMIAISIGLTLISGVIPARLAAKKDPVEALRTE